jgi:hypothetical protein
MFKNLFYLFITISLCSACNSTPTPNEETSEKGNPTFGEVITENGAVPYGSVLAKLEKVDTISVKVAGKIESVCQKKGCWMNLVQEGQPDIFVKFKDYAFFMPLDCAGKEVVMEGIAFKEITPVDELRHYAEDEGQTAEEIAAITEPKEELKFLASGVVLLEDKAKN